MDYYNQNVGARRLALLYTDLHNADSAAKYALYSYDMMDSVYKNMQTQDVERLSALFNYNKFQNEAQKERDKSAKERQKNTLLIIALLSLALFIALLFGAFVYWRKKKELQLLQYQNDLADMEKAQTRLMQLHSEETDNLSVTINGLREEIESMQQRIDDYHRKSDRQLEALERRIQDSPIVGHWYHRCGWWLSQCWWGRPSWCL